MLDASLQITRLQKHSDAVRLRATRNLTQRHRSEFGQFLTPSAVAAIMASYIGAGKNEIVALDPGSGTGTLVMALAEHLLLRVPKPRSLHVVCYEIEEQFLPYLRQNLDLCAKQCNDSGLRFTFEVRQQDFLEAAVQLHESSILGMPAREVFDVVITNPPYRKIATTSEARRRLRALGVETVNLYSGFVAAAATLLRDGGELVAITPRSFCNGPYYRDFRKFYFSQMSLRAIHIFEKRDDAFKEDEVLQETIITYSEKSKAHASVQITASERVSGIPGPPVKVPYDEVIAPNDPEKFVRISTGAGDNEVIMRASRFKCSLRQLGIEVSTGKVVDFRSRPFLLENPDASSAPLIYPTHFDNWEIKWPALQGRKPNALRIAPETASLLLPSERFVLTKRFSSKEETRRIVAAVYEGTAANDTVAFENHLNYFHASQRGLDKDLAWGLTAFLNSKCIDLYFRTFNGHTQVNATDLRSIRYPTAIQLKSLGVFARKHRPNAEEIDTFMFERLVFE